MGRYLNWLRDERGRDLADYDELWRWSVEDLEGFWGSVWDFFGVRAHAPYERVLAKREMPGAEWFPGARLNYAEHVLGTDEDADRVAVVARSQTRDADRADLRRAARSGRAGARGTAAPGRRPRRPRRRLPAQHPRDARRLHRHHEPRRHLGDVRAGVRPRSVLARFGQIEPEGPAAVGGYTYRDRPVDRREQVAEIRVGLPTLEHVVHVPYGENELPTLSPGRTFLLIPARSRSSPSPSTTRSTCSSRRAPPACPRRSSTATAAADRAPQGRRLGWDLKPGGRLLWFSTTRG